MGSSVNSCTKGIWIWGKPIDATTPEGDPIKVLVIDTEGLGAFDKDQIHDSRIFSLSILLSSYFMYNSKGTIDSDALQNLNLVVNLTKHIQIKSNGVNEKDFDASDYAKFFPSFMWVVRDFNLRLENKDGEEITSNQYLEEALRLQEGNDESVENRNRIRRILKNSFNRRECFTLMLPSGEEEILNNLGD